MAGHLNRVIIMGNLTRDVELRHLANNMAVGKFGLASNRRWKTPEGEAREEAMFIDCEAWGRTAEIISQYFAKGKPILVEGRLKLDQWEDKETKAKRSKHVLVVENFHFVESKGGGGGGGPGGEGGGYSRPASRPAAAGAPAGSAAPAAGGGIDEDDIPF
jgi:single-strand DNA-binding protein